jgi:hypothetical protein
VRACLDAERVCRPYEAGSVKAPISNVIVKKLPNGSFAFACSALTTPDGQLFNPETEKKPHSSARVYTGLFVRHWDAWNTRNKSSIFYGLLEQKDGKYALRNGTLTNALAGTGLSSPVPPFGGTGDFDIGPSGLVFVAKDPELDPAIYTKTNLYYIPLETFTESSAPPPRIINTPGLEGYSNSPVFSHCGRKVAFTRMRSNQYESDKPRLLLVPDITNPDKTEEFYATPDGVGGWDARPESIVWSHDDSKLYVTAEHRARTLIFQLASTPSRATALPVPIKTPDGSVVSFHLLRPNRDHSSSSSPADSDNDHLLVTSTSLVDNSCYSIADPAAQTATVISSASKEGKSFGLSRSAVDSITFRGAGGDYDVHALVVRPSTFDRGAANGNGNKKYPLCLLIHGGPQGAWLDAWSTRWNPAVFAEQGYVVVCPNPTGSTGYGMAFEDGIRGEWGGRPYNDLVRCVEWVAENMPEVDVTRAVALGASYGGFMISEFALFFCLFFLPIAWIIWSFCLGRRFVCADDKLPWKRLDPGTPARAQVQSAGVPRRSVQHAEPVELRGAVLPHPRFRGDALRQQGGVREVGPGEVRQRVGDAAAGQSPPSPS